MRVTFRSRSTPPPRSTPPSARAAASRRTAAAALAALALAAVAVFAVVAPSRAARVAVDSTVVRVVDPAGALSADDTRMLDASLTELNRSTGVSIVALVDPPSAASTPFAASAGSGSSLLVEIDPGARRARVVRPAVGATLSAVDAEDVVREEIAPYLRQGRLREAIDHGARALAKSVNDAQAASDAATSSGWDASSWLLAAAAFGAALTAVGAALLLDGRDRGGMTA